MTESPWKITLKDVVICAALIWAYQYAMSQQLADIPLPASLDEITNHLWQQLKQSGHPDTLEKYKKLFHFSFEKEFQTCVSLLRNERHDMLERSEQFLRKIGYNPQMTEIEKYESDKEIFEVSG